MYDSSYDYVDAVVDEIALEGLDGITLEGLWVRLSNRPNFRIALDDASKAFLWNTIRHIDGLTMYKLPVPRKPLVIFDRYNYVDKELGMVLEPDVLPEDLYPHCAVEDAKTGVRGSCSTYYTRVDITDEAISLSLREVDQKWGMALVVVASQALRNIKLMSPTSNPRLDISLLQYCLLERIGRSRHMGEVTQGKVSLQVMGEAPKALFYYRKVLLQHKLIVKQVHHLKMAGHNCSGSLLHLPRFHVERKPKILHLTEKVIMFLKSQPQHIAEYSKIREILGFTHSFKNLLKNLIKTYDFQRYVRTDLCIPYRQMYPNAKVSEWKHKGSDKEKQLRVLQLLNPDMDVQELWSRYEDNMYEEDETDPNAGMLDCGNLYMDQPLMTQAFRVLDKAGPKGISQLELGNKMGLAKLQARVMCRNLLKKGIISTYMNDVGRQRVSRFVSIRYEKESLLSLQFAREKDKMLTLLSDRPVLKEKGHGSSSARGTKRAAGDKGDSDSELPRAKLAKWTKKRTTGSASVSKRDQGDGSDDGGEGSVDSGKPRPVNGDASSSTWGADSQGADLEGDGPSEKAEKTTVDQVVAESGKSARWKDSTQTGFVEDLKNLDIPQEGVSVSYRLLKRANLIIETVRSHKVIYDLQKLMKLIYDEEGKEGYNVKMDKKSLLRLLLKLAHDGNIKIFKVYLKTDTKEKVLSFVCDPTICADHTVIQSAIEQAKMKFFIPPTHRLNKVPADLPLKVEELAKEKNFNFETSTIAESMKELKSFSVKSKEKSPQYQYNSRMGKLYGLCPKFVRMKKFHQFLYYLIYAYEGDPNLDRQVALRKLEEKGYELDDNIVQEAATIYCPEASWKMFVAPLPVHQDWPQGWTIMCDILLRLPLSVFVEIYNITYIVPNMQQYLDHPIRRHYLLKYLPLEMRNIMMIARKYIFSIHEIAQHLCYAGLLQFGPQRLKEKDQVFVYLNRRATLLDTTLSRQGYHQVSDDIDYPEKKYEFNSMADIDTYWYDMWNISVHTRLGGRMCMMGKDIVLEVLRHKQVMVDALKAKSPEEAIENDVGSVPGDKRGAAGLDSALFAHLKRNWSWSNQSVTGPYVYNAPSSIAFNKKLTELKSARLASLKMDLLLTDIFQVMTKKNPADQSTSTFTNVIKKRPPMVKKGEKKPKPEAEVAPVKEKKKRSEIVRTMQLKRSQKRQRRPFYDDVDQRALRRMCKLRVEWTPAEDNLLLLCKVAAVYLCPNNHKQHIITLPMIRDVLHKKSPKYKNKTSRACQRRILYMMKSMSTACNVALHLEEVTQDPEVSSQFKNVIGKLREEELKEEEFEARLFEKFRELVDLLEQKSSRVGYLSGTHEHFVIPDTVEDFRNKYLVTYPRTSLKKHVIFREAKNIVDVCCAVANTVIHSSLCCMLDRYSDTYRLFQVYQQYPDNLLRSVITRLRSTQMVSLKKCYTRKLHRSGHYMPISSLPYQLSISYVNLLQTKYQFEVFHESYEMMKQLASCVELSAGDAGMEVDNTEGGRTAAFVELFGRNKVTFKVEVPDQIIVLDPRIVDKDETFARIVQRYKDIVTSTKYRRLSTALKKHYGEAFANLHPLTDAAADTGPFDEPARPSRDGEDSDFDSDVPDTFDESVEDMSIVHHNAIARAASRIALYMLREDSRGKLMNELQHAHDFFVVNSCKVMCHLTAGRDGRHPDTVYPISQQMCDEVVQYIERSMVFDDEYVPTPDDLRGKCVESGGNNRDWENITRMFAYIKKKKEMGATVSELKDEFVDSGSSMSLLHILDLLRDSGIVLRTGVCNMRYVHYGFTKPWLVRSYRIKSAGDESSAGMDPSCTARAETSASEGDGPAPSEDRQADGVVPEEDDATRNEITGSVVPMEIEDCCESPVPPEDTTVDPVMAEVKAGAETTREQEGDGREAVAKHVGVGEEIQTISPVEGQPIGEAGGSGSKLAAKTNRKSWKKCMSTTATDCKDDKVCEGSNTEKIKVHVRPWVRIDGTLNRRVLDRMLGAVLGHAMHCPGEFLNKFKERFAPALQPFHVCELIEILQKLGCVKPKVLKVSWKATLFSKPSIVSLEEADGTEEDTDIILEPAPDAILRLGKFIGEKDYLSDFLCC